MNRIFFSILFAFFSAFCLGQKVTLIRESSKIIESFFGKTIVKKLTQKETASLATKLTSSYSHIPVNPQLIDKSIDYCTKNGCLKSDDFARLLSQLDSYAEILNNETKGAPFWAEGIPICFEKNMKMLTSDVTSKIIDKLGEYSYRNSSKLSFEIYNHVVLRHCLGTPRKSKFIPSFAENGKLITCIEETFSMTNYVTKYNDMDVYIKKYSRIIGKGRKGDDLTDLVVYVKDGKVATAFPGEKNTIIHLNKLK